MTILQHTPKPWRYVGIRRPLQTPQGRPIEMYVVSTNHKNGAWESIYSHVEADARLIAAAPELLEALKACKTALQAHLTRYGPTPNIVTAENIAADAIDTAEGR